MPDRPLADNERRQTVDRRYLNRESLQACLEQLFPGQTDFKIRLQDEIWSFIAPRVVETVEFDI
ncbi:hypothetical protein PENARI_c015G00034 [Penicillium arizonense]|uniref:Uncharacterized protein n=1 Tax=Penicillium arizonense TaxID=1835702 RepID=A0A1F5LCN3_PENAI|nr:hypothetical protein PENARI_c015G00034 [Penicillium arizonense]OGE50963.1 hypothetical protein PENARI_c015G00034 [Penicillium arizonense]